jgi:hypothetical protein
MTVHYCLGLGPEEFAEQADPLDPTRLAKMVNDLTAGSRCERFDLLPTYAWTDPEMVSSHVIAQLQFRDHSDARDFHAALGKGMRSKKFKQQHYAFGQDPVLSPLDVWSPLGPGGGIFGDRSLAEHLTGSSAIDLDGATGKGVNVIIVDRGLDRDVIGEMAIRMAARRGLAIKASAQPVLGWTRYEWSTRNGMRIRRSINPGATGSDHAHMIARNVLAIAPQATLWDAPLLPLEDEQDAPPRLATVGHLFHWIKRAVASGKVRSWYSKEHALTQAELKLPCIVVNAWGVMDPQSDPDPAARNYADDPDHFLINDVGRLAEELDVVFAAGNCGEPCPDQRCGINDCGPGHSIFGLNGHPEVLSVGAVRSDGLPIALSAQGPGRLAMKGKQALGKQYERAYQKPDLCAPSHFRESDDAFEYNTGTSAACGFAAGILAALRSHKAGQTIAPERMRALLRSTARRAAGATWDPRLGYGIIHAESALQELKRMAPP